MQTLIQGASVLRSCHIENSPYAKCATSDIQKKEDWHLPSSFFALFPLHALVHGMTLVAELALIGGELRYVVVIVGL